MDWAHSAHACLVKFTLLRFGFGFARLGSALLHSMLVCATVERIKENNILCIRQTAHSQHTISKPPKYCTNSRIHFWLLVDSYDSDFLLFSLSHDRPFFRSSSHSVGVLIFPSITVLLYNIALIFRKKNFSFIRCPHSTLSSSCLQVICTVFLDAIRLVCARFFRGFLRFLYRQNWPNNCTFVCEQSNKICSICV